MKAVWLAAAMGVALVAPAYAQDNPVKTGVEAWERGDYRAAVDAWRRPAMAGDADAQFNLAQAYKLGRGVPTDLKQAEDWYRRAAAQNHPQAEDNYGLALFQNGKTEQAVEWLTRSASRGEPRAQFVLGTMFFNGDAVEKDWVRAYALMTRASQSGLDQASEALAQMDQHISLDQRRKGLALARKYEVEFRRTPPRVDIAETASPLTDRTAARPESRPPARPPVVAASAASGPWRLQLGAFADPDNARRLWRQVDSRFPGRQPYYVRAGRLTKMLVGPFATRREAARSCDGISPCVPVMQ